jgi:translation elongation factor EF-1beta
MKIYTFKVTIAMSDDTEYYCDDVKGAIREQDDEVAVEVERIDTYVTKVED